MQKQPTSPLISATTSPTLNLPTLPPTTPTTPTTPQTPGGTRKVSRGPTKGGSPTIVPSEREAELVQVLLAHFLGGEGSIAVVVLKVALEGSAHSVLYQEVMAPYHNSLHTFFDRHPDDFYIWNYTAAEIAKYGLAPYFKTDETRVASRRPNGREVALELGAVYDADGRIVIGLRAEEAAILASLISLLTAASEQYLPRKAMLEALRTRFPSSCAAGGILSSANAFHRFVARHPNDVSTGGVNIYLGKPKLCFGTESGEGQPVTPPQPCCTLTIPITKSPQSPPQATKAWQEMAAAEYFKLT